MKNTGLKQTRQRGFVLILGLGLVIVLALLSAYTWLSLSWSYSTGERAGYVQKFSHKGFVCKTWEGELAIISIPGTLSEKFYFSVMDDDIASKVNKSLGKKVSLSYEQHIGVPSNCFGETQYFVTDVHVLE